MITISEIVHLLLYLTFHYYNLIPLPGAMGARTTVKKAGGEAGADAALAGVAEGSAPAYERTSLLRGSGSNGYSTMPSEEDVRELAEKKHFNLAGLPPRTFWILVRCLSMYLESELSVDVSDVDLLFPRCFRRSNRFVQTVATSQ